MARRKTYTDLDAFFRDHPTLTHEWLAKQLGVNRSYVSLLRSGERRPGRDLAVRIERITGVPVESFVLEATH